MIGTVTATIASRFGDRPFRDVCRRENLVHDLQKTAKRLGFRSSNVYHLNGDITINMLLPNGPNGPESFKGHFKKS